MQVLKGANKDSHESDTAMQKSGCPKSLEMGYAARSVRRHMDMLD